MRLGSTCSSLRQASLTWFSEVFVHMLVIIDVASLAAWLERHPGEASLLLAALCRVALSQEAQFTNCLTHLSRCFCPVQPGCTYAIW
jgi:hypothetical protein